MENLHERRYEKVTEFGTWIRQKRMFQGMTQTECAERAGMKLQQWNRMEKTVTRPAYDTLIAVSKALRISLEEVLAAADYEIARPEPVESRIGKKLEPLLLQVPPAQRQAIENVLEDTARTMVGLVSSPNPT